VAFIRSNFRSQLLIPTYWAFGFICVLVNHHKANLFRCKTEAPRLQKYLLYRFRTAIDPDISQIAILEGFFFFGVPHLATFISFFHL
jgi:hypothetical protein